MRRVLVTGGTGFIGSALIRQLKREGYWVRCADILSPRTWASGHYADEFFCADLRQLGNAEAAAAGVDWIFALAANMGGMGFIGTHHAEIVRDNSRITLNTLDAAVGAGADRLLYASSACVYPVHLQQDDEAPPLREADVYPADPQGMYGWEKLHGEHLCETYREAEWLDTRVVRFHNAYGPEGTWRGGREKAPAALCRKVAVAKRTGDPEVEIWGSGKQRRSYMYIDDCIEGLLRLMRSDYPYPMNVGRDRSVSVDELADIIANVAGIEIIKKHVEGPEGVQSRNSDNSRCLRVLEWEPGTALEQGLVPTYKWVEGQLRKLGDGIFLPAD